MPQTGRLPRPHTGRIHAAMHPYRSVHRSLSGLHLRSNALILPRNLGRARVDCCPAPVHRNSTVVALQLPAVLVMHLVEITVHHRKYSL